MLGLDRAVAPLGALRLILGALDLQAPLLQRGVVILLERLGRGERGLDAGGGERGQQRVGDRLVDLGAADPETPLATALDEHAARAVVGRAVVASPALVVHLQLAPAVPADRDSLQQRGTLANGAARLVRARARVARDPLLVCLERLAIDEAGVVLPDQDLPVCLREATDALARLAVLVDVAFTARLAEGVGAGVDGVGEHAVHLVVARRDPTKLTERRGLQGELHRCAAQPQPYLTRRAELGEALEDHGDRAADRLVGMQQHLAVPLAPDQPDRQPAAQLAALGLVADPAVQARPEHVQLGLAHRALQAEQQPVVERPRVIDAVGVADHGIGHAAQIEQPIPVGVVASQPGGLQAEHQAGVAERDLGRQAREPRALRQSRARDAQVLVDHDDLLVREPQRDRPLDERVLALGRLDVALELRLGGLADIHERGSAQVRRRELRALTHGSSPAPRRPSVRSAPRAASSLSGAAPRPAAPTAPPPAPGSPPDPDATALSVLPLPAGGSSRSLRTTRSTSGSSTRRAPSRSCSDPNVPAGAGCAGRSRSVHAAGINARLSSGSTRISSSRPPRRIQPISASARPSNG